MEKALKISDLLEGKARVPQGAPESPQKGGWVSVVDSERAQAGERAGWKSQAGSPSSPWEESLVCCPRR